MGESETVVAQTSSAHVYPSSGFSASEYPGITSSMCLETIVSETTMNYPIPVDVNNSTTYIHASGDADTNDGDEISIVKEPSSDFIQTKQHTEMVDDVLPIVVSIDKDVSVTSHSIDHELFANGSVCATESLFLNDSGGVRDVHCSDSIKENDILNNTVLSTEEDRLWSIVGANSLDFSAWTALIEETEKMAEENIMRIRKMYDAFLAEFPLCYGYWKKYADHEARCGSIEKVIEVYERAVNGVTYSVDMWLHYCIFAIGTYPDPDTVRRLFERGLAYVGTDYLSYTLWDKYIEYEYSQHEWSHLAIIYTRILDHPNQQLDRYFNSFKELAGNRALSDLQTAEEAASISGAYPDYSGHSFGGGVNGDDQERSPKPVEVEVLERYIAIREDIYKKTKEFDCMTVGFETAIRRPYFHVRPLNITELENWHNYLDFMEKDGEFNKIFKLYERCLIACANYPEYWIRYVLCMEAYGGMDLANNALERATQVFVKRQPEIHIFAARYKEHNGDIDGARASYQLVHTEISPGLLEAIIKHSNMEYRMGKLEDACLLYEQAITIEKGKEHSQALPMLYAQYSRFLYLVSGNADRAREILVGAVDNIQLSKPLLEALIHLESILPHPKQIDFLDSLVEKFILPSHDTLNTSSNSEREEISSIFVEFVDLFGDIRSIKKADIRHSKLFLPHKSVLEVRKRHAEDFLASEKAKLSRCYSGGASGGGQAVMGTYPSAAQGQWAGYGIQPQAWPQGSQLPTQAWASSPYSQQQALAAAYGGAAAGYSQTTQPQASAQTASVSYAGYATPAYPSQAYPQQTTAAVPSLPAQPQQQHPASSAYYTAYY